MIRLFLLALFSLFTVAAKPQTASPFVFAHYSTKEGLASNGVYKILQDREGFLWIATSNGLQRFDGVRFRTFHHEDANAASLPSDIITSLYLDKNDVLWGLTNKAEVFVFDKNRFTCKRIPVIANHPTHFFQTETMFVPDLDGRLFLLNLDNELLGYDEKKHEFSQAANFIPLPPERMPVGLVQQPGTKKYWLGLYGGGLAVYNRQTGNLSYYGHNTEHEPAVEIWGDKKLLVYPFFDKKGRLWAMTWGPGIPFCLQYDPARKGEPLKSFSFYERIKTYHELGSFTQQSDGRMWIRGLNLFGYFNEEAGDFVLISSGDRNGRGINYEGVLSVFEDREKNVWVGTTNNGLYRFNPSAQYFTNVFHLKRFTKGETGQGAVMSFVQLKNGNIFAGTWEDALLQYSPDFKPVAPAHLPYLFVNAYLWSMCASADSNTVWMGAQPGFWEYKEKEQTARLHDPPQLEKHTVRQIAEDKGGNLWLGMHGTGVFRCLRPTRKGGDSIVAVPEVGRSMIHKIVVDRKGLVWIGTADNGLFVFDGATARLLHHWNDGPSGSGKLPSSSVCGLLDYNDSLVFIADDLHLYSYNRNNGALRLRKLGNNLGGVITAVERDDEGYLWVSTSNAIHRMHPTNRMAMVFDRQDGILNDQFVLSASYRLRDGRLLFGTSNSFIAFDPKVASRLPAAPVVHITGVQVEGTELPVDSVLALNHLELKSKANSIVVEFATLELNAVFPVQYKMEGIDKDWRLADADGKVTYPYLPPARYRLLLRAYKPDGVPAPVTELQVLVRPPWYQTWWFYALAAIGFVAELWWLDRQRSKRKAGMQRVRTDIAANLHEEINTALNNINILSEIARLKSDREPQKAKEYLEQIHSKSHNMIIALDDMLWSLNPENDTMDKTISRIREYADALMQRHRVLIELLIDKKVEKLELNMKLRHEAFLLFKEGLRSLVEAGTPHCIVHLTTERTKLLFTIEFSNEGCNLQQLNNLLHRHDMDQRIRALKAKLDVQLHKSRSLFLLQLPLG